MKKVAIIDLGTNTCNLLIAEYKTNFYNILLQTKEVVKLAKDIDSNGCLSISALQRASIAINNLKDYIAKFETQNIILIATSAVRESSNCDWFRAQLEIETGIKVRVISSEEEASYIFKGTMLSFPNIQDNSLILDIGGGSNEFIISERNDIKWLKSFKQGMARIIAEIPPSDPITSEEIKKINDCFENGMSELWNEVSLIRMSCLIGCSGAFDTLADLIDNVKSGIKQRISQEIIVNDFVAVYEKLIKSTIIERRQMIGMESIRIEMIIPAIILIKLILTKLNINKMYQCGYALREGVLYELILD